MAQEHAALNIRALLLAVAALAGGCGLPNPYRPAPATPVAVPAGEPAPGAAPTGTAPVEPPPVVAAPTREYHLGPAAKSLVTQARAQVARGEVPAAAATLDRALKIEPTNPLLWIELGRLRLAENDPRQAEGCSRKALVLASGDRSARAQAGRVLADALRAQRRNQEAREVESQPYMN